MDQAQGWLPDPEHEGEERYWSGSEWTDLVRPAGQAVTMHLPEHVPELHRALTEATADIHELDDRLSALFDRTDVRGRTGPVSNDAVAEADADAAAEPEDFDVELYLDFEVDEADDAAWRDQCGSTALIADARRRECGEAGAGSDEGFAELDAALAAEMPEHFGGAPTAMPDDRSAKRSMFRRRS